MSPDSKKKSQSERLGPVAERDTAFAEFVQRKKRARNEAMVSAVGYVRAAMANDWRAAMTYLERTDPEHWSRPDRVAHSGHVRTTTVEIPDDHDRMAQVVARLREAGALPEKEG